MVLPSLNIFNDDMMEIFEIINISWIVNSLTKPRELFLKYVKQPMDF